MSDWVSSRGWWSVRCVSCGATDRSELLEARSSWSHRDAFEARKMRAGWRLFVGRGRRWYCPDCGPSPRHQMHEVTR